MKISFDKIARIRINDIVDDYNFTWWANYKWDDNKQIWHCTASNSGFHTHHNIGYELTAHEMTILVLQSS